MVEAVCTEATAVARVYIDSIRDIAELEDTTGVELYQGRLPGKARSMVATKADKLCRAQYVTHLREVMMLLSAAQSLKG